MEFSQIIDSKNLCYLDTLFNAIMALSIVFGIVTLLQTRKQNNFNSVKACNDMFRDIVRKQQVFKQEDIDQHQMYFRDHMGLVYEELFYMRQGILPKRIALEWLAEMPKRVPVYTADGKMLNLDLLYKGENSYLFKNHFNIVEDRMKYFEGVMRSFTIDAEFDFTPDNWNDNKTKFSHYIYIRIRRPWYFRFWTFILK